MMNLIAKLMTKIRPLIGQNIYQGHKKKMNKHPSQLQNNRVQSDIKRQLRLTTKLTSGSFNLAVLPNQPLCAFPIFQSIPSPAVRIEQNSQFQINTTPKVLQKKQISKFKMEQEEQAQVPEVFEKDLKFKEYSSLELSTRDKFINAIKSDGFDAPGILWVASEKIHGSNFSIHCNGETVYYGRRTDFLTKEIPLPCDTPQDYFNQSFYDAKKLVQRFHNKLKDVFENIRTFEPDLLKFSIYGEYFGGNWPADHPANIKNGPKQVQKGIYYTPNHEFYAFDIYIVTSNKIYWADVLDIPKLLKDYIPTVPVYGRGTFEQVFAINSEIDSTIPQLLGLPKLNKNIIEGFVIRPNKNLSTTKFNQRVIIKKKNQEFLEKASEPNPAKKEKKEKEVDPELVGYLEELAKYINVNRINSVVSKYPDLKDRGKLRGLIIEDILADVKKDEVKLPEGDKHKKLMQEFNGLVLKEINAYYIKH